MAWYAAKSLVVLQRELDARFPSRLKPDWLKGDAAHAGTASDHNPRPGDGAVCAIDVRSTQVAAFLWNHLLALRDSRLKYAIFNRQIVSSTVNAWHPRPYHGSNPHSDHIHISVGRGPDGASSGPINNTHPWSIVEAPTQPQPQPQGPSRRRQNMLIRDNVSGAIWNIGVGAARHVPSWKEINEIRFITGHGDIPSRHPLEVVYWMRVWGAWDWTLNKPRKVR